MWGSKMAEIRTWRNTDRTWLKDVVPLDTPYNLQVDISSVCNARCVYCQQSINPQKGIMSLDFFKKVMDMAKDFPQKIKTLDLYDSGEPLCNPYISQMVSYAKKTGIFNQIGITSNGLLLTPELIDKIIEAGLDVIRISIQGLSSEAYHHVCGVSLDFDKFLSNLSYLYSHRRNCKVRIKIVDFALKDEIDGESRFYEMFQDIADSVFIEQLIPIYGDVNYGKLDQNIVAKAKEGRYHVSQNKINKVCYRPFIKLLVGINGDVTASCCDHPVRDVVYGNLKNERLIDIWNGSRRRSFLKMQLEGKRFSHIFCKDCMIPNDITDERDFLDPYVDEILRRF